MKTESLIVAALVAAASVTAAWAAAPAENVPAPPKKLNQLGRAQKLIGDELRKPTPDVGVIRANAQTLANLAPQVHRWFPRGTGKESGAKTAALPAIWQQTPLFNTKANQFTQAARGLQQAATRGDVAQIRAALPAVGGSCKGCHDTFKGDK
ncbi:MAG: c-type cytochrome [Novosphingobium sp.]